MSNGHRDKKTNYEQHGVKVDISQKRHLERLKETDGASEAAKKIEILIESYKQIKGEE